MDKVLTNGSDHRVLVLEERVRRLEDVVASLQDTRQLEARVAETVSARMAGNRPGNGQEVAGVILSAGRQLFPTAVEARPRTGTVQATGAWILFEIYAEARCLVRMYLDPRYRLGWCGRVLPLVLLAAIITSFFWIPGTSAPILGTLIDKVVDLVLAFVLFKVLHREVTQYRQLSPDLPVALRL